MAEEPKDLMAALEESLGVRRCDRCSRTSDTPDGWRRLILGVRESDEHTDVLLICGPCDDEISRGGL
jgi:hypothetical protein